MKIKRMMEIFKADTVRTDGRLERHCEHGYGHTVGHINWKMLAKSSTWVHGCDGCCEQWEKDGDA